MKIAEILQALSEHRVEFVLVVAFLYLPIVVVVGLSFNASGLPTAWTGFSLDWYRTVLANEPLLGAFRNTLIVGLAATVVATFIGTLLALGLERTTRSALLDSVVYVPMIVPDIVLAIALLSFYNLVFTGLLNLQLGLWTVILSHVVFDIAFVAVVLLARPGSRRALRAIRRRTLLVSIGLGAWYITNTATYYAGITTVPLGLFGLGK